MLFNVKFLAFNDEMPSRIVSHPLIDAADLEQVKERAFRLVPVAQEMGAHGFRVFYRNELLFEWNPLGL